MPSAEKDVSLSPGWWAGCIDCGVTTIIDKGDSEGVPDPAEWDGFPSCIVCGGSLSFDEASESQWDRESRLMRAAREAATRVVPPGEGDTNG